MNIKQRLHHCLGWAFATMIVVLVVGCQSARHRQMSHVAVRVEPQRLEIPVGGSGTFKAIASPAETITGNVVIIQQPEDQIVTNGSNATFLVIAEPEDATYQWFRNDVALHGANRSTLELTRVTEADVGHYRCEIGTNPSVSSATAQLQVYSKMRITATETVVTVSGPLGTGPAPVNNCGTCLGWMTLLNPAGKPWFSPPSNNIISVTLKDLTQPTPPSGYQSTVGIVDFPHISQVHCSGTGNRTLRIPAKTNDLYEFTVFVNSGARSSMTITASITWTQ